MEADVIVKSKEFITKIKAGIPILNTITKILQNIGTGDMLCVDY